MEEARQHSAMTDTLPEILHLKALLESLENVPDNHRKRGAGRIIAEQFASITGTENLFDAYARLVAVIQNLSSLADEQFPEAGRKAAAYVGIGGLKGIFSPINLAIPFDQFLSNTDTDRRFLSATILLFDDVRFDSGALLSKATDIVSEIDALKEKIAKNDGLSHASKLIIGAQLTLIERSLLKVNSDGVGPFRDSVFTSIGRIYVELRGNNENDKIASRETLDDLLRIYGLLEAGGTLLSLGAPVTLKLVGVG